jgi:D-glycero-D-manno-heptose 1,7-bisphosphate phosphatase
MEKNHFWKKIWQMNLKSKNRAIFLDRDGVINVDKQYVCKIEDFEFKEGVFEVLRFLQDEGYLLIVVTNQSGIGRGYYTFEDFRKVTRWKLEELERRGVHIDEVYHCPHAPEWECDCRKPSPKMLLEARDKYGIDMQRSWMIGDKKSDIDAGKNAGVGKTVLISEKNCKESLGADFCICNITELAELVERYGE